MKKLIWLTDIHLDFLDVPQNIVFVNRISQKVNPGDSVVITGDIAEGASTRTFMWAWRKAIADRGGKLYFVLGNHDFYDSSMVQVQEACRDTLGDCWLPEVKIADLGNGTDCLVGHDGWWDGLYANWFNSRLEMEDYKCIAEFRQCPSRQILFNKINEISQGAADHVHKYATEAAGIYKKVYIATHVPPFREASVYGGKISNDTWMPHFSSKRMGDAILAVAKANPDTKFVVLCGHSHGGSVCNPSHNVECHTGFAEYRNPSIANTFNL